MSGREAKKKGADDDDLMVGAAWVSRIEGGAPGEAMPEAFSAWQADPENARLYERLAQTWHDPNLVVALQDIEADAGARRPAVSRVAGRIAASFAACAAVAALLYFGPEIDGFWSSRSYVTHTAQRTTVVLTDGTRVALNADTQVNIRMGLLGRWVKIVRGEALFQVSPDPGRPFRVVTPFADITVIGTRFNVDRLPHATEIKVYEGRVGVAVHDEFLVLGSGEHASVGGAGQVSVEAFDPRQAVDWQEGWLEVDNEPLDHVLAEINRYTHRKIVLADATLGAQRVSGRFLLEAPEDAVRGLSLVLNLVVSDTGGELRIARAL